MLFLSSEYLRYACHCCPNYYIHICQVRGESSKSAVFPLDSDIINDFSTNQSVIGITDCTGCQKYHAEFSEPFSFFEKEPCIINCKPGTQDTRCLSHQLRLLIQCIKTEAFIITQPQHNLVQNCLPFFLFFKILLDVLLNAHVHAHQHNKKSSCCHQ